MLEGRAATIDYFTNPLLDGKLNRLIDKNAFVLLMSNNIQKRKKYRSFKINCSLTSVLGIKMFLFRSSENKTSIYL